MRIVVAVMLASAVTSTAFSQTTAITYQGRLNDGGILANGSFDFTFSLFNSVSGGVQQGVTLTNIAAPVSNGLFTARLDFGNQFPGADRWLAIGVRTNGFGVFTSLSPRQALTPTPYAVYASSASVASVANSVSASNITGTVALVGNGSGISNLNEVVKFIFEGDSITAEYNSATYTNQWSYILTNIIAPAFFRKSRIYSWNGAVQGQYAVDFQNQYPFEGGLQKPVGNQQAFYLVMGGVNDLGQNTPSDLIFSSLSNCWRSAKLDGYYVIASTVTPNFSNLGGFFYSNNWYSLNQKILGATNLYDVLIRPDTLVVHPSQTMDNLHWSYASASAVARMAARAVYGVDGADFGTVTANNIYASNLYAGTIVATTFLRTNVTDFSSIKVQSGNTTSIITNGWGNASRHVWGWNASDPADFNFGIGSGITSIRGTSTTYLIGANKGDGYSGQYGFFTGGTSGGGLVLHPAGGGGIQNIEPGPGGISIHGGFTNYNSGVSTEFKGSIVVRGNLHMRTNAAPADAVTIKAWIPIVATNGQTYLIPAYQ